MTKLKHITYDEAMKLYGNILVRFTSYNSFFSQVLPSGDELCLSMNKSRNGKYEQELDSAKQYTVREIEPDCIEILDKDTSKTILIATNPNW